MKILFIGGLFKNQSKYIKNTSKINQTSADNFQKMILKILNKDYNVHVLSMPFVGTFPTYYKEWKNKRETYVIDGITVKQLFFLNIKGLYLLNRFIFLTKEIIKMKTFDTLMVYSINTPFLLAASIHKKLFGSKIILIVPDLPQYMNPNSKVSKIKKVLKKIDLSILNFLNRYIDGYVFLTKYMNTRINKSSKPYIVVETVLHPISFKKEFKKNYILYSGTLNSKYGIKELVDEYIGYKENSFDLIICGTGELDGYINEVSKKNERLKFLGNIDRDNLLKLQKEALFLVNPRKNNEEYTKFSFPSKITEYLSSGRPVVCYKLDGIGNEYDSILFYAKENKIIDYIENLVIKNAYSEQFYQDKLNRFIKEFKTEEIQLKKFNRIISAVNE
ncbi:hypothetical protein CW674_08630 [Macrococcoides caseolyticum]|uniref:glycosyltransferase n=1 Tax=Macrococcoides caseolyticum TaxID=69966 RepID=UPI000C33C83D|nr:glycosyltransferase [Macrococcus caseolyticus]PKE65100.1 hypothetical protein CW674_08630 [Macrococcus caseolyticus]